MKLFLPVAAFLIAVTAVFAHNPGGKPSLSFKYKSGETCVACSTVSASNCGINTGDRCTCTSQSNVNAWVVDSQDPTNCVEASRPATN